MEHKCPKCGSVIYSRKNVLCGRCGEQLPSDLLFSKEERERVEREWARNAGSSLDGSSGIGGDIVTTDVSGGVD